MLYFFLGIDYFNWTISSSLGEVSADATI